LTFPEVFSKKYVPLYGLSGQTTTKSESPSESKSIGIGQAHRPTPKSTVNPGELYFKRLSPSAEQAFDHKSKQ
jgi:hypothetical protein